MSSNRDQDGSALPSQAKDDEAKDHGMLRTPLARVADIASGTTRVHGVAKWIVRSVMVSFFTGQVKMKPSNIEQQIEKLDPKVSKIYFDAKHDLVNGHESYSEAFANAAQIVRAFWN